jgi:hypothetical protein
MSSANMKNIKIFVERPESLLFYKILNFSENNGNSSGGMLPLGVSALYSY